MLPFLVLIINTYFFSVVLNKRHTFPVSLRSDSRLFRSRKHRSEKKKTFTRTLRFIITTWSKSTPERSFFLFFPLSRHRRARRTRIRSSSSSWRRRRRRCSHPEMELRCETEYKQEAALWPNQCNHPLFLSKEGFKEFAITFSQDKHETVEEEELKTLFFSVWMDSVERRCKLFLRSLPSL